MTVWKVTPEGSIAVPTTFDDIRDMGTAPAKPDEPGTDIAVTSGPLAT